MRETSRESNFTRHWVRVRLQGFKTERLISRAMEKGITLRRICYRDETEVYLSVAEEDFREMKKMAGSRYRLTVIGEGGYRPAWRRLVSAKAAIAGVMIFAAFFAVQSLFIREISVTGCTGIPESEIRSCIAEEGLYEGTLKRFDCDSIERKLFTEFDSVVWAKVSWQGGFVQVEIAESRQTAGGSADRSEPCHIVAEKDCYIERILVYRGRGAVKEEDFVRKGDILISGIVPVEHPSYQPEKDDELQHYVHAEGKIAARVPYYFSFYMEPETDVDGTVHLKSQAETLLRQWIKENVPAEAQILNKDFHFYEKKNIIRVYGTVETRQQVGVERKITREEKESAIDERTGRTEENTD